MEIRLKEANAFVKKDGLDKCTYVGEYNGKGCYEAVPKDFKKGDKIGLPLFYLDDGNKFEFVSDPDETLNIIGYFAPDEEE